MGSAEPAPAAHIVALADVATCPDCLRELFDSADRRHRYPFVSCTNCGPRFSIVESLPFARATTTMRAFELCPDCRAEYEDPRSRRFQAPAIACPACGPQLRLLDRNGAVVAERGEALAAAVIALRGGRILALKGMGGYQLVGHSRDGAATDLRQRLRRPARPLALMVRDLDGARRLGELSRAEEDLLASRQAPIVLLDRRENADLDAQIAPGRSTLGVLLPTTPLHHLLVSQVGGPLLVVASGPEDQAIVTDDLEARRLLGEVADLFLTHDRPIARSVGDSVARIVEGAPFLLRRARGFAPLPIPLNESGPALVAVGAPGERVAALATGRQVFLTPPLGKSGTVDTGSALERSFLDFVHLYDVRPAAIAHDLRPDDFATQWAHAAAGADGGLLVRCGLTPAELPLFGVQHHHAHLASLLAEQGASGACLAATWDGVGFAPDGTLWGGEVLLGDALGFERVARLRPFRLLGGEIALREPWRVALALLWQIHPESVFDEAAALAPRPITSAERIELGCMLEQGVRSLETSSVGRLFDGVATLIGLPTCVSFAGENAIRLESISEPGYAGSYPIELREADAPAELAPGQRQRPRLYELDWRPLVAALLADQRRGVPAATLAARFHAALADAAIEVAIRLDAPRLGLTGGCFQNRTLTSAIARRARAERREAVLHRQVPAGNGGIALGQIAVVRARLAAAAEQEG